MANSYNIQYPITLFAQPTNMTCWSAATTMLLGTNMSVGPGGAATSGGGLAPDSANVADFARAYGLKLFYPQSWSIGGLVALLTKGPVVMMGAIPTLHAVVIGGIAGEGTAEGTQLTIFDPWPPLQGSVYWVDYNSMMQRFPMATMYMLQKP